MTFQYLFRMKDGRLPVLLALVLPAGVCAAAFFPINGYFEWVASLKDVDFATYGEMWQALSGLNGLKYLAIPIALVALSFSIATLSAIVTRSMRVGKFQSKGLFHNAAENVIPAIAVALATVVLVLLAHTFICLILFTIQKIINRTLALVLTVLVCLILSLVFILGISTQLLWLPIMTYSGIKPVSAMMVSFSKVRKIGWESFVSYLFCFFIIALFGFIGNLIGNVWYLNLILNSVSYSVATLFIIVLSLVTFFDTECITREDLVKKPYLRR